MAKVNRADRDPFLKSLETEKALHDIVSSDGLIIYCGAGVTYDRTGVGWNELVSRTFENATGQSVLTKSQRTAMRHTLQGHDLTPKQAASAVFELIESSAKGERLALSRLVRYFRKTLYEDSGWSKGRMLGNLSFLVVLCAFLEKEVKIVTTNYDEYLDSEILKALDEFYDSPGADEEIPGVIRRTIGIDRDEWLRHPVNTTRQVCIHYIHGRVGATGKASADLVFSEGSYFKNHKKTYDYLVNSFHSTQALLVIGSSIADEPLIEALAETKQHGGTRYALTVLPNHALSESDGEESTMDTDVEWASAKRGESLGLRTLFPDSFSQAAQFVEELRICVLLKHLNSLEEYSICSYPKRLELWWKSWSDNHSPATFENNHQSLRQALDDLIDVFDSLGIRDSEEKFRLELWTRNEPSISKGNRHLTLFANSTGPLLYTDELRKERIDRFSRIASIKAFNSGRPLLCSLEDLGFNRDSSRWKSFLAVPVYIEPEIQTPSGLLISGTVPIGVITLCSTLGASVHGEDFARSVLWNKNFGNDAFIEVVAYIVGVAREIMEIQSS